MEALLACEEAIMQGYAGLLLVVLGVVMGCAGVGSLSEGERPTTARLVTDRAVPFYDGKPFDQAVSEAMGTQAPSVTVPLLASTTVNSIPPRLGTWLAVVRDRGGKVDVQPDPEALSTSDAQAKGWIDDGLIIIWRLIQTVKEWQLYKPAAEYDVMLYYRRGGELTKVVFIHK